MREILVTGGSGLVGSRFIELSGDKYKIHSPSSEELNITNLDSIESYLSRVNPGVLINFAAYTDVGKAEEERDKKDSLVWKLNVEAVSNLRKAIPEEVLFIQISTDMVFSGTGDDPGPYGEDHHPVEDFTKVTFYGYSKGQGEKELSGRPNTAILRIIYPVRAKYSEKLDYLRKPLSLYDQGKLYPMFTDQQVSFAFIDEISMALEKIIDQEKTGVFHASSSDTTSPYEAVSYLIKKARSEDNAVKPSSLDDFLKTVNNPVRYPKYGGLKVEETEKQLGIKFSSWKEIIDSLVEQGVTF